MFLFAQPVADRYADLVLAGSGVVQPMRDDTYNYGDPLYRAAAVANVAGGLTYMSWADYQKVVAGQTGIQAVKVGADCASAVEPTEASVTDGSYTLSQGAILLVSEKSLSKVPCSRSCGTCWAIPTSVPWRKTASTVRTLAIGGLRELLQDAFKRATEAAAAAAAVATPEPTAEATWFVTTTYSRNNELAQNPRPMLAGVLCYSRR